MLSFQTPLKRLLQILFTLIILLTVLYFISVTPTRMVVGSFACDCANSHCSALYELTNHSINTLAQTGTKKSSGYALTPGPRQPA